MSDRDRIDPALDLVQRFIERVNRRDTDGIGALLTEDHLFIDSLGQRTVGRERVRDAWSHYFRMAPDYELAIDESFARGDSVVLIGSASGTLSTGGRLRPENRWSTPAAWRARVAGELLAEWRVYADNEPIRALMRGA